MRNKEVWIDISGYEGMYQVSNLGNVRSVSRKIINRGCVQQIKGRVLKQGNRGGYLYVILSKNGKIKSFSIHQLVAKHFIPNPQNKPQVNHLDENPLNNNYSNLAWVTSKENNNYGNRNKRVFEAGIVKPKRVSMYSKDGQLLRSFSSIKEASAFIGKGHSGIAACARGERKTAYGFIWK